MKSTQYSEKVLDHFKNPRNVGTLKERMSCGERSVIPCAGTS